MKGDNGENISEAFVFWKYYTTCDVYNRITSQKTLTLGEIIL